MPPRVPLRLASKPSAFALRPRFVPVRHFADEKMAPAAPAGSPTAIQEEMQDPKQKPLGHVSEEAADVSKTTGEAGPEIEQGTHVQEVRNIFSSCGQTLCLEWWMK